MIDFEAELVAGTVLVRQLIQSQNYVAGVSGWAIYADGNAEFNDITARGDLIVTDVDGSQVKIVADGVGGIQLRPMTAPGITWVDGQVFGSVRYNGLNVVVGGSTFLASPTPTGGYAFASVDIQSATTDGQLAAVVVQPQLVVAGPLSVSDNISWGATNKSVAVSVSDSAVVNGTTASTAFTNTLTTSGVRGVAFVAPPSGSMLITGTTGGFNSTVGQYTLVSWEVRTGTTLGAGTVVRASDENTASQAQAALANNGAQHAVSGLVTGLVPGSSYNACLTYRVTANTGTFNRRTITAAPTFG